MKRTLIEVLLIILCITFASLYIFNPRVEVVEQPHIPDSSSYTIFETAAPDTVIIRDTLMVKSRGNHVLKSEDDAEGTNPSPAILPEKIVVSQPERSILYESIKTFDKKYIGVTVSAFALAPVDSFRINARFKLDKYEAEIVKPRFDAMKKDFKHRKWRWFGYGSIVTTVVIGGIIIGVRQYEVIQIPINETVQKWNKS